MLYSHTHQPCLPLQSLGITFKLNLTSPTPESAFNAKRMVTWMRLVAWRTDSQNCVPVCVAWMITVKTTPPLFGSTTMLSPTLYLQGTASAANLRAKYLSSGTRNKCVLHWGEVGCNHIFFSKACSSPVSQRQNYLSAFTPVESAQGAPSQPTDAHPLVFIRW